MFFRLRPTEIESGLTEQVVVGVPLVLEGQSSIADMVQILQPLKIRHSHTTSVQVHVLQGATQQTLICPIWPNLPRYLDWLCVCVWLHLQE